MSIKIQLGPGNSIEKNISHTDQIEDGWVEFLGGNPENIEYVVNGVTYAGPLSDGQTIDLRQKVNAKG